MSTASDLAKNILSYVKSHAQNATSFWLIELYPPDKRVTFCLLVKDLWQPCRQSSSSIPVMKEGGKEERE